MQNEFGQEIPDDMPVVINIPGRGQIHDHDQIREYIHLYLSQAARDAGEETFEEANDFDVEDDEFPVSPHEYREDTERADREVLEAGDPRVPRDGFPPAPVPPTPPTPGNPGVGAPPAEGPPPSADQ